MPAELPEEPESRKSSSRLSGLGFEFVGAVVGLTLAGYWWDGHFGTGPWGILIGLFLGLVGGTYNLIRQSMLASRASGREIKKTNGDGPR
ncbi:MAG TPA: AtpZ/AtpI family protein [Thermoanaerobaculia bacterium]|jgi:F0F1-type ATP synthase assembly protein I